MANCFESCHYGGGRGHPAAAAVSGQSQAHDPPVGAAGDGAHHQPAEAARNHRYLCYPVLQAPGGDGLLRRRGPAGGAADLVHRG